MKNLIKILLLAVFAFVVFFGGNKLIHSTSDDKFCVVCHEWMDPMVKSYEQSIHGGANKMGLKAKCADCHLPHDSYISYVFQKAKNGISEISYMVLNDAKDMDWQKNRKNRKNYVYDSGCISCHEKIVDVNNTNEYINDMHKIYINFKDKDITCVSCHKNVGHKQLGKTLHDIKNPPVGKW